MTDVRALLRARAGGDYPQQVIAGYVSTNQPEPAGFNDPIYVVIPSLSTEVFFGPLPWPVVHGGTLPRGGDVVTLGMDGSGALTVLVWQGTYSPPPCAVALCD